MTAPHPGNALISPTDSRAAWLVYSTVLFSTFATIEAGAFQAAAMPAITRHFDIPVGQASLITLFYFIGSIAFAPVMGRQADRVGHKRVLLAGMALFTLAEVAAFSSVNFPMLLASRLVEGLALACISPVVLAYAGMLFTDAKRGTALGAYVFAASVGSTSGGLMGGLLIDRFGWSAIYWVGFLFGLFGCAMIATFVPVHRPIPFTRRRFDWRGVFLLVVGIAGVVSVPAWADRFGYASPQALASLAIGFVSVLMLLFTEKRVSDPIVDSELLRKWIFVLPAVIYLLYYLFYTGLLYSLTFFLADRPGGNAAQIGVVLMFLFGSNLLTAPVAGRLIDRIDPRRLLLLSLVVAFVGAYLISRTHNTTPLWMVISSVTLLGIANGAKTPAVMKIALGPIRVEKIAAGTGLLAMLRDLGAPAGTAFGLAVYGATVGAQMSSSAIQHARDIGVSPALFDAAAKVALTRGHELNPAFAAELTRLGVPVSAFLQAVRASALDTVMESVTYVLMGVLAMCIFLALLLSRKTGRNDEALSSAAVDVAQGSPGA